MEKQLDDKKLIKKVDAIILNAIEQNASSIHLEVQEQHFRIRYRIDGALIIVQESPKELYPPVRDRFKAMSALNLKENDLPQDGRIQLYVKGSPIDLRIATNPTVFGESIVVHIIHVPAFDKLDISKTGLNNGQLNKIREWTDKSFGSIYVTGPTGSGKTTVLYLILKELIKESVKICTVEDPVEIDFEGVSQVPVKSHLGLTFTRAVRAFMRQDPDIIMVGEIRDLETAQTIVQASLTGHLILTTLHTRNATDAVMRLHDMGLHNILIYESTNGIIAQRLVRKLCPKCRKAYKPDAKTIKALKLKGNKYYQSKGCKECRNTGYRGRIGIFELFEFSDKTEKLILSGCSKEEFRKQAIADGMKTLWDDAITKAESGITSIDEVLRVLWQPE